MRCALVTGVQTCALPILLPTCRLPVGEGAKRVVTVKFFIAIVSRNTPPRQAQGFYGINRFVLSRRSERVRDRITTIAAEIARAQLHPRRSLAQFIFGAIKQALTSGRAYLFTIDTESCSEIGYKENEMHC